MSSKSVGSSAEVLNLVIEAGATFSLPLRWIDEDKNYIDLTGYKAILQVRDYAKSNQVLLEMTTENGMIVLGKTPETKGRIFLKLDRNKTAELDFESGKYQLELEQGDSVIRLLKGKFTVDSSYIR